MGNERTRKIILVAGARPNFMKIAPIYAELSRRKNFEITLVHTGQHYDEKMSKVFFEELNIPPPDINLGVGSGTHAIQTTHVMTKFEEVCLEHKPNMVVVVGDINSTLACSLVASKLQIPIAHIESGLRSFDKTMPEEINRILTDRISDHLFTTEESANTNLINEGVPKEKIYFVGNVMIDNLINNLDKINSANTFKKYQLQEKNYCVLTLHRPENVDNRETLEKIINTLSKIQNHIPIICPLHPRTLKNLQDYQLYERIEEMKNFIVVPPLGYVDFLNLVKHSKFILTDSGGIQEEATYLKIPCITIRKNTERPVTISSGTNKLTGVNEKEILGAIEEILRNKDIEKTLQIPPKWDGKAAKRIVEILSSKLININVLYISGDKTIDPRGFNGKSRHVQGTLRELKLQGCVVGLISSYNKVKFGCGNLYELVVNLLVLTKTMLKFKLKGKYNLIYERFCVNSLLGVILSKLYKIPFFLEFNYSYIYGSEGKKDLKFKKIWFLVEKYILNSADRIFTVSSVLKEYLVEIGVPKERIVFAPIGVDVSFFNPKNITSDFKEKDKFTIGFVGSFQDYHGIDIILDAVEKLKKEKELSNLSFLFVGEGQGLEKIKHACKEKNINNIVTFTGMVPYKELPSVIDSFDIALMSTPTYKQDKFFKKYHGFPAKLLEYMAMEKVVIAPDVSSISDSLITGGVNGILTAPGNHCAIAEQIKRLYKEDVLRKEIGTKARETIVKKYTWEIKIEKIINSYKLLQQNYESNRE